MIKLVYTLKQNVDFSIKFNNLNMKSNQYFMKSKSWLNYTRQKPLELTTYYSTKAGNKAKKTHE